jgi:hypothetical protein
MPLLGWLFVLLLVALALLLIWYGLSGLSVDVTRAQSRKRLAHLRKLSQSTRSERKPGR